MKRLKKILLKRIRAIAVRAENQSLENQSAIVAILEGLGDLETKVEDIDLQYVLDNKNYATGQKLSVYDGLWYEGRGVTLDQTGKVTVSASSKSELELCIDNGNDEYNIEVERKPNNVINATHDTAKISNVDFKISGDLKLRLTDGDPDIIAGNNIKLQPASLPSHGVRLNEFEESQDDQNQLITDLEDSVDQHTEAIKALQEEIERLAGAQIKGYWRYNSGLAAGGSGEWQMVLQYGGRPDGSELWQQMRKMRMHLEDAPGRVFDFVNSVKHGDIVEYISQEPGNEAYAMFEVDTVEEDPGSTSASCIFNFTGGPFIARGIPAPFGSIYEIRIFSLTNDGGIDMPTADARYVNVTGDVMDGSLKIDVPATTSGYRFAVLDPQSTQGSNVVFGINKPSSTSVGGAKYYGAITDNAHITTREWVKDYVDNNTVTGDFVSKKGDTMEGDLYFDGYRVDGVGNLGLHGDDTKDVVMTSIPKAITTTNPKDETWVTWKSEPPNTYNNSGNAAYTFGLKFDLASNTTSNNRIHVKANNVMANNFISIRGGAEPWISTNAAHNAHYYYDSVANSYHKRLEIEDTVNAVGQWVFFA